MSQRGTVGAAFISRGIRKAEQNFEMKQGQKDRNVRRRPGGHPEGGWVCVPLLCIDMNGQCDSFLRLEGGRVLCFFLYCWTVDCPCYCVLLYRVYKGLLLSNTVGFNRPVERVGALAVKPTVTV